MRRTINTKNSTRDVSDKCIGMRLTRDVSIIRIRLIPRIRRLTRDVSDN